MSISVQFPYPVLLGENETGDFPDCTFTLKIDGDPKIFSGDEFQFRLAFSLRCEALVGRLRDACGNVSLQILYRCPSTALRCIKNVPVNQLNIPARGGNEIAFSQTVGLPVANFLKRLEFSACIVAEKEIPCYRPRGANAEFFGPNDTFYVPAHAILAKTNTRFVQFEEDATSANDIISVLRDPNQAKAILVDFDDSAFIRISLSGDVFTRWFALRGSFRKTVRAEICLPALVRALTLLIPDDAGGNDGNGDKNGDGTGDCDENGGAGGNEYREKEWGKILIEKLKNECVDLTADNIDFVTCANSLLGDVCAGALDELYEILRRNNGDGDGAGGVE